MKLFDETVRRKARSGSHRSATWQSPRELRQLARKAIKLEIAKSISAHTVMRTLKPGLTKRKIQYLVISPEHDSEFVASMQDALSVYERPYSPEIPGLCMDEQPMQPAKEVETHLLATKTHSRRVGYQYERAGVANVFMLSEP